MSGRDLERGSMGCDSDGSVVVVVLVVVVVSDEEEEEEEEVSTSVHVVEQRGILVLPRSAA